MNKHISIITYNRSYLLEDCIESLNKVLGDSRSEYTIIVFDDGSTDDTKNLLEQFVDDGLVDDADYFSRGGVARNSNRAIRTAKTGEADLLFLCNDDIEFIENPFPIYEDAIKNSDYQHFCYTDPASPNKAYRDFSSNGRILTQTKLVSDGVFLTITRDMIEKLGGFNEAYGLYGIEHIDYSRRASIAGFASDVLDVRAARGTIKVSQYYRKIPNTLEKSHEFLANAREVWTNSYMNPTIYQEI